MKTAPVSYRINTNEKVKALQRQGNVYYAKGMIYYYAGDNSKALQLLDKALTFFEKTNSPIGQGSSYLGKGIIYFETGNNLRALEMYDKAEDIEIEANALHGKAKVLVKLDRKDEALDLFEKAIANLEKEELLLRYFISRENVYVFFISKKDFNVVTMGVNEKDINEIVSEYLFSIEEKNSRRVRK